MTSSRTGHERRKDYVLVRLQRPSARRHHPYLPRHPARARLRPGARRRSGLLLRDGDGRQPDYRRWHGDPHGRAAERARRAPLLRQAVPMRVMLHQHVGFNELVPVNRMVPELLALVPGVEVLEAGYTAPGYMCASFTAVPKALDDIHANTVRAAKAAGADAVVTVFH